MAKRYYWLKLKEDFFEDPKTMLLVRERRGKEVLLFYIYLLTKAIEKDGRLSFDDQRGYTSVELARLSGFTTSLVNYAICRLQADGYLCREPDGSLFLPALLEMVGSEGESAVKMRKMRSKGSQCDQNVTESKSIEKEIEIEVDADAEVEDGDDNDPHRLRSMGGKLGKGVVFLTEEQDEKLLELMDLDVYDKYVEKLADFIIRNDAKVANHYKTILKWYQEDCS